MRVTQIQNYNTYDGEAVIRFSQLKPAELTALLEGTTPEPTPEFDWRKVIQYWIDAGRNSSYHTPIGKITLIKAVRETCAGIGLKEAKDLVERYFSFEGYGK